MPALRMINSTGPENGSLQTEHLVNASYMDMQSAPTAAEAPLERQATRYRVQD